MRRLVFIVGVCLLLWARAAHAAPTVSVQASPSTGAAPLAVTFTATGDAVSYHWQFGDGAEADGAVVQHTYTDPRRYTVVVTATGSDGSTSQATAAVTAYGLSLRAPSPVRFGKRVTFRGSLVPVEAGARVVLLRNGSPLAAARTRANGSFRIRARVRGPGSFQVSFGAVLSDARSVRVRPVLMVRFRGAALVGNRLALVARVRPAAAGRLHVVVLRGSRKLVDRTARGSASVALSTAGPRTYVARIWLEPLDGYLRAAQRLRTTVAMPRLSYGSRGASVRFLEQRLAELRYALERVDGYYGQDTYDAVLAFQKIHWLSRTGSVDRGVWRRLRTATVPRPRYRSGTHIEVDKARQVLFDVRGGKVARVIQASTGATGNTPPGIWHVYLKDPGFNHLSMYYSMYFVGNFAVHGYPSVPPYPASHGCVRVPLWVAYSLYMTHGYGTTVIIY